MHQGDRITVINILDAFFISFQMGNAVDESVLHVKPYCGVILCTARMLTHYNRQRRSSATGGAVAVPLDIQNSKNTDAAMLTLSHSRIEGQLTGKLSSVGVPC